jgi:hypothetical protein
LAWRSRHAVPCHRSNAIEASGRATYLHCYFCVQDEKFGLVYLRVPTWAPLRLPFYCNGDSWLARKLTAQDIGYTMADNAFVAHQ